ncbi:MAG: hypothetical protein ABSC13_07235 [Dehalococcoidia bacterium]
MLDHFGIGSTLWALFLTSFRMSNDDEASLNCLLLSATRRQRLADGLRLGFQVPQISLEFSASLLFAEEATLKPWGIAAAARAALLPARTAAAVVSAVTAAA